jgi:hypothetical protein
MARRVNAWLAALLALSGASALASTDLSVLSALDSLSPTAQGTSTSTSSGAPLPGPSATSSSSTSSDGSTLIAILSGMPQVPDELYAASACPPSLFKSVGLPAPSAFSVAWLSEAMSATLRNVTAAGADAPPPLVALSRFSAAFLANGCAQTYLNYTSLVASSSAQTLVEMAVAQRETLASAEVMAALLSALAWDGGSVATSNNADGIPCLSFTGLVPVYQSSASLLRPILELVHANDPAKRCAGFSQLGCCAEAIAAVQLRASSGLSNAPWSDVVPSAVAATQILNDQCFSAYRLNVSTAACVPALSLTHSASNGKSTPPAAVPTTASGVGGGSPSSSGLSSGGAAAVAIVVILIVATCVGAIVIRWRRRLRSMAYGLQNNGVWGGPSRGSSVLEFSSRSAAMEVR